MVAALAGLFRHFTWVSTAGLPCNVPHADADPRPLRQALHELGGDRFHPGKTIDPSDVLAEILEQLRRPEVRPVPHHQSHFGEVTARLAQQGVNLV